MLYFYVFKNLWYEREKAMRAFLHLVSLYCCNQLESWWPFFCTSSIMLIRDLIPRKDVWAFAAVSYLPCYLMRLQNTFISITDLTMPKSLYSRFCPHLWWCGWRWEHEWAVVQLASELCSPKGVFPDFQFPLLLISFIGSFQIHLVWCCARTRSHLKRVPCQFVLTVACL